MSSTPHIHSTLPETPIDEWAHITTSALSTTATAANGVAEDASTPSEHIPGAYPDDATPQPQEHDFSNPNSTSTVTRGAKDVIHHTAEAYIASERLDQVEHLVEGVGSKAAQYVPTGVASVVSSYWCESFKPSRGNNTSTITTASTATSTNMPRYKERGREGGGGKKGVGDDRFWTALGYVIVGVGLLFWGDGSRSSSNATQTGSTESGDAISGKGKDTSLDRSQSRTRVEGGKEKEKDKDKGKGRVEEECGNEQVGQGKEKEKEKEKYPIPLPAESKPATINADPTPVPSIIPISQNTQVPTTTQPTTDSANSTGSGDVISDASPTPIPASTPAPALVSSDSVKSDGEGTRDTAPPAVIDPQPTQPDGVSAPQPQPLSTKPTPTYTPDADIASKDPIPGQPDSVVAGTSATDAVAVASIQPSDPTDDVSTGKGESNDSKTEEKPNETVKEGEGEKKGYDVSTAAPAPVPAPAPTTPSKPAPKGDSQYHPALLHPRTASYSTSTIVAPSSKSPPGSVKSKKEADKDKEKHSHGLGHGHHSFSFGQRHKRTSSIASASSSASVSTQGGGRKKVGFLDKVKGETKVIIGKIEHKPEKVEEGKRILRGED